MSKDIASQLGKLKQTTFASIKNEKQLKSIKEFMEHKQAIGVVSHAPYFSFLRAAKKLCEMYPKTKFLDLTEKQMVQYINTLSQTKKAYKGRINEIKKLCIKKGEVNTLEVCKELKIKNRFDARNLMRELSYRDENFKYTCPPKGFRKGNPSTLKFVGKKSEQKFATPNNVYSKKSIESYMQQIKAFFRWLNKDEIPKNLKWLFKRNKNKKNSIVLFIEGRQITASDLISTEELTKMTESQDNPRNQALVETLWDSGARNTEFRLLKIKHIVKDKHGIILNIPFEGKTGFRTVRLIRAVPYLERYLNVHKDKDNPEAPLFYSHSSTAKTLKALEDNSLNALLKRFARDAKIKKNVFPHLFRHSKITDLVRRGLNEGQLRKFAGWGSDSDMPKVYVHLSGVDTSNAILEAHGIINVESEIEKRKGMPIYCETCGQTDNTLYAPTDKFCKHGHFLKVGDAMNQLNNLEEKENIGAMVQKQVIEMMEKYKKVLSGDMTAEELVQTLPNLDSGSKRLGETQYPKVTVASNTTSQE